MFKLNLSLVFVVLISMIASGQETISGVVYSGSTERPLAKAKVRMGNRSVRSDDEGKFVLPYNENHSLEAYASGHYNYDRKTEELSDLDRTSIFLVPKPEVSGLRVSAESVPVYAPDFEYVFDYEFIDNMLITITYLNKNITDPEREVSLQNCALSLFDRGVLVHRIIIPDFPRRFRKSAFNDLFIEGLDYSLLVKLENDKLSIEEYDYKEFVSNIIPWTVAFSEAASGVGMIRELPQVVHYMYYPEEERFHTIRIAQNPAYFKHCLDDYAMLSKSQATKAKELGDKYGFRKELFAGYIRASNRKRDFRRQNPDVNLIDRDLRKPYTPAYKYGNDLIILDAMNQWIYHHNNMGQAIDSVYFQVDLPAEELWQIKQDRVNQKLYAIHQKSGVYYLRKINPASGSLGKPMKIAYPFPKKIEIYNGNVFYIRHDSEEKIKHLYKEFVDFQ